MLEAVAMRATDVLSTVRGIRNGLLAVGEPTGTPDIPCAPPLDIVAQNLDTAAKMLEEIRTYLF